MKLLTIFITTRLFMILFQLFEYFLKPLNLITICLVGISEKMSATLLSVALSLLLIFIYPTFIYPAGNCLSTVASRVC
ncbi:Uncharacterised protein [Klebsiella pneumoniae]|nr:Uncharacterised protein [Klebsiella pneumoniae]